MTTQPRMQKKSERLENRCTKEQKLKIKRAAELCGSSVTDFTINTLMRRADEIIKEHSIIELSMKDQMAFANALLNPPDPNKALLKAKQQHQKIIRR